MTNLYENNVRDTRIYARIIDIEFFFTRKYRFSRNERKLKDMSHNKLLKYLLLYVF